VNPLGHEVVELMERHDAGRGQKGQQGRLVGVMVGVACGKNVDKQTLIEAVKKYIEQTAKGDVVKVEILEHVLKSNGVDIENMKKAEVPWDSIS